MLFFKGENLDELQLRKRGDVFKHGLFIMSVLIFCNAMLHNFFGFIWTADRWPELTIMLFTITVCSIEFIYYDIYPLTEKRQKHLIYFVGVFGFVSIALSVYEMISENIPAIVDKMVSTNILGILYGCMFIAIFVAYIIRSNYNEKNEMEDSFLCGKL